MATEDTQLLPPSIRPLLAKIGLDGKQIEIYLALLSLHSAKASDIAKAAGQSRSHAYVILRTLEEMGLVSEIDEQSITRFIAEPPERLLGYLKDRERESRELRTLVEGALPVLSALTGAFLGAPRVTVLKGMDGMKHVYRDILTQEFVGLYNAQTSLDAFGQNVVTMLLGADAVLRGRDLLVDNAAAKKHCADIPPTKHYQIRLLPKNIDFTTDTIVYGDSITFFAYDADRTIVRIDNHNLANTVRTWFEVLWSMGREVKG